MIDSTTDELHTVRDWLRWAVSRFNEAGLCYGHGTENAWDEAVWLVLATLHLPRDTLEPWLDAHLTKPERLALLGNLQQRVVHRLPTAYLVQEAWLGEFRFYVDQRVIVPRSYFAELLQTGFAPWIQDPEAVESALDLCTGSGCLAILMANAFPNAAVDAIDISADALVVASRNIADYHLEDRVKPVESDLFAAVPGKRYDLIVCNPPYVTADAMAACPRSTATSRRWRWPPGRTASTWCAASSPRRTPTLIPAASSPSRSATTRTSSPRPSPTCRQSGSTPNTPQARSSC
jgi:ribosomal protein L3 glutamine methyltransferase